MPPLSLLDHDLTHDLLWAQKIPGQILGKIHSAVGSDHSFFKESSLPIALIERIIVGPEYPWADNWSGQVYELLRWLSQCHVFYDPFLSGTFFGFEYPWPVEPGNITLPSFPPSITLAAGDSPKVITWLERSHEVESAPYCDQISGEISVWIRRARVIPKNREITLDSRYWLFNSVVTNADWVGVSTEERKIIEYDKLPQTLAKIEENLNLPLVKWIDNFNLLRWG